MTFSIKRSGARPGKRAFLYAGICGILVAVLMIIGLALLQEMEFKKGFTLNWVLYTILLAAMLICPIMYAKSNWYKIDNKPLNTRRAYIMCVGFGVICACAYSLLLYGYIMLVDPNFVYSFIETKSRIWQEMGSITEIERLQHIKEIENIQPSHICMSVWAELIMVGVLVPLLISVIVRKER